MSEALLITIITVISGAVGTTAFWGFKRVIRAIDNLAISIMSVSNRVVEHQVKIEDHGDRIEEGELRIHDLEIKQASCRYCTP